jgi:hypothetical protein
MSNFIHPDIIYFVFLLFAHHFFFLGMIAYNHVDVKYAHYGLDFYPGDANHTAGLFVKNLHDLEQAPIQSSRIFIYGCGTPLLN